MRVQNEFTNRKQSIQLRSEIFDFFYMSNIFPANLGYSTVFEILIIEFRAFQFADIRGAD